MDATCAIQASIHVFSLVRKYVSRILGTYQTARPQGGFCRKAEGRGGCPCPTVIDRIGLMSEAAFRFPLFIEVVFQKPM